MFKGASIKTWLLTLAFLATLPVFIFAIYIVYQLSKSQEEKLTTELLQRTSATANAVTERLNVAIGYLEALASTDAAQQGNIRGIYEHAQRIVQRNPNIRAITLIDREGRLLFITLRPFGPATIPSNDGEALNQVFQTGKPIASGPFKSPISSSIVTTVGVPVFKDGKVAFCLRMVLLTDSLNDLLAAQKLPPDWTSAITDNNGLLIARSRNPEKFVGKEVSPTLMKAIKDQWTGVFQSTTLDGIRVTTTVAPVPGWTWKVAIGVPTDTFEAPMRNSLRLMMALGGVLAIVGVIAALKLSRRITHQVAEVVRSSKALENGLEFPEHETQIKEFHELAQSLRTVEAKGQKVHSELLDLSVRHEQISAELSNALCDGLTGLPCRAMFLEQVEGLRKAGHDVGGRMLALLFIDLDGFKQVNDTQGHDAGDRVLIRTAEILKDLTRDADIAGRLGGDEFVICLSAPLQAIEVTARSVASRVVQQVSEIGSGIGCSIGIAVWVGACPDLGCVMRRADEAMYEAKRRGKNRYVVYGAESKLDEKSWSECGGNGSSTCLTCNGEVSNQ